MGELEEKAIHRPTGQVDCVETGEIAFIEYVSTYDYTMKVLCLILASDTAPEHVQFQALWRRFMHKHPNVDCYFYKAHPDLRESIFLEDRTLWIRMNDTFETVYEKTLRAFEYFLPKLNGYDFVYRSNLSTFVSFDHMLQFCNDLPRKECCAAVIGGIEPGETDRHSLKHPYSFPGGNGFLLSPDLVRRLVEEKEPLDHQDDVTIGNALRRWKIPIREFARIDYQDNAVWFVNNMHVLKDGQMNGSPQKTMFSYRLKTSDRKQDVLAMDMLIRNVYAV